MEIVPDDVVISGIGGYFPKALNIEEFKQRLFSNEILLEARWPEGMINHPQLTIQLINSNIFIFYLDTNISVSRKNSESTH